MHRYPQIHAHLDPHPCFCHLPHQEWEDQRCGSEPVSSQRSLESAGCLIPGLPFICFLARRWFQAPICMEGLKAHPELPGLSAHIMGVSQAVYLKVSTC